MKKLRFLSSMIIFCLIIMAAKTTPVKAGGSLTSYFNIANKNTDEYYSWFELESEDKTFSPMQGDEYTITISPDENTITELKVTVDSSVAEVSEVYESPALEEYNEGRFYKKADLTITGEPGTTGTIVIKWTVQDQYDETLDQEVTLDFTIFDSETKPYDLGSDTIKILGEGSLFPSKPSKFTATRYEETDEDYKELANIMAGKFGDTIKFIYYNLELEDVNGEKITRFNDYIKVKMYISYTEEFPEEGEYVAFSFADDGTLTPCVTTYEDGYLTFLTNHFSNYVVTVLSDDAIKEYEPITTEAVTTAAETTTAETTIAETTEDGAESVSNETTTTSSEENTDSNSLYIAIGVAAVVVVLIVGGYIIISKRKKNK